MNRTYRTLWSETTQTYVAVAENVKSHGKKSGSLKTVSAAVAAALLTLSAGQVMAVDLCTTTSTTIGTAVTGGVGGDNCVLDNGESVIVSSGGSISNTDQVNPIIVLTGATNAGSITNSGTISNTGTGSSVDNDAIAIYGQLDDVINDSLIQSNTGAGVSITNGGVARYIINSGTIESGRDSVNVNSSLMTGGITNSGTASHMIGDSNGIFVANSTISGNIVNEGTIQGLGLSSSAGISLRSSNITGGITNSGSVSVISGATNGIYLGGATNHFTTTGVAPGFSSVGGAIQNSGLIEGAGQNGIWLHGASVGSIVNEADAVISGGKSGIKLSSRNWAYFTSLSATIGSGVFKSTITGSITNRGLISAGTSSANANHVYGIHMLGVSTMGGSIINEGTIAGLGSNEVAGIALFSGSIITTGITNSGLISGSATSGSGIAHGISLKTGSAIGGIVNHGRIEGLGGSSSSGQGVGVGMADSRINGSIINFGTIEGVGYSGVGIGLNTSTIDGGITNSGALGSIVGSTFGLALANSSIGNSSIVGDIVNIDGARIEGQSVGIMLNRSTITGGITNSGTLSGGHTGIELALSTITGAIFNEGTINGNLTGIYVYSSTITGGITNSGTLSQILGDTGIYLYDSSVTGAIFNQGTIGGGSSTGIYVYYSTIAGGITNSGTLSQILGGNTGISLTGSTITGAIFNEGTINGIYVSGTSTITGGITNSGTIGGGANAIYVAGNSTLDSIQIQGNNTAKFIGVVDAANTPVTVAIGATYTMDDGQQFTVSGFTNDGTLKIGATTTAGSIGTITGDFTNSSSGIFSTTVVDATHYGQLTVTGTATLAGTLAVDASHAIGGLNNGDILSGIINAANRSGTFSGITDNSVLHDFTAAYSNSVDLTVTTASGVLCYGSLSGSHTGPCLVAFDAPDLINSFTISGGTAGVNILSGDYTGSVTNTGKISGSDVGIRAIGVNLAGGITNSGTSSQIIGGSTGLLLSHSTITGAIINEGTISGRLTGIDAMNSTIGGITNSGTISGGNGIFVGPTSHGGTIGSTITGGITNSGLILGNFNTAIYVAVNSTVTGGITNSDTISGVIHGIATTSSLISGGITNSGLIAGGYDGIYVDTNSLISGGITNSGTISGGSFGIFINHTGASISGGITNSGLIHGDWAIASHNGADGVTGSITNAAGGKLVGGLWLVSGTNNLVNDGTIVLASGVALADAAASAVPLSTVSGAITTGSVSGNFTQGSGGLLRILVDGTAPGHYGQLSVGGNATLAGTLDVDVHTTTLSGSLLDVITATGTIGGTFAQVTDNSALFDFSAIYPGTNAVDLGISAASATGIFDDVVAEGNTPGTGAAIALDTIINDDPTGPIALLFQPLGTQREVSDAVSQTLPLLIGGMNQSISNTLHGTSRIIQSRQEGQHGRSTGDEFFGDQHAWFKPFGSWANQNDRNGVSGFNTHAYGMVFGADAEVTDNDRVGIAFSYAHSNIDGNSSVAPQSANVSSYQLVGYGSHNLSEDTDINFQADIGQHNNTGQRNITFASTIAKSDYTSWTGHVGVGLAHNYTLSEKTTLTPSIRADYAIIRGESYTETGAGALNLNVNANTTHELILGVDSKLAHALTDKTTLTANIGVGYDTINKQASMTSAFAGSPSTSFVTYGLDPSPWLMRGGLGIVGKMTETVEVSARYDIEARKDFDNQTASVKLRWAF